MSAIEVFSFSFFRTCSKVFLLVWLLSACFPGVYKLDIPQGNILEEEKIDQLKMGMTKRQVRYLLGTPLMIDSFNQDRWVYYYSYKRYKLRDSQEIFYEARLVLTFDKGILVNMEKNIPKTGQENGQEAEDRESVKKQEEVPDLSE
jgi:outer membrane protein assembly factor BamE